MIESHGIIWGGFVKVPTGRVSILSEVELAITDGTNPLVCLSRFGPERDNSFYILNGRDGSRAAIDRLEAGGVGQKVDVSVVKSGEQGATIPVDDLDVLGNQSL
jgi:hypothetical protein